MPGQTHVSALAEGRKITGNADNTLNVPDNPVIPYIEGDASGCTSRP